MMINDCWKDGEMGEWLGGYVLVDGWLDDDQAKGGVEWVMDSDIQ